MKLTHNALGSPMVKVVSNCACFKFRLASERRWLNPGQSIAANLMLTFYSRVCLVLAALFCRPTRPLRGRRSLWQAIMLMMLMI